ncbi:MAG: hypothetical protein DI589_05915 [Shinella sp.]|nr:MAG: hypothetical protein DI589_05915 [Shinella sp.]
MTLAKTSIEEPHEVMTREKRQHLINRVVDTLSDWRCTPFENEGAIRAGLRAGMCVEGHSWTEADDTAQGLLVAAFQRVGARRPSWEQGQRQYTIAEENCNWCGMEIADEDRAGNRKARFCSSVCARSALVHRDWETRWKESSIGRSAFAIIRREEMPQRECEWCGLSYHPFNAETKNQRFCSFDCSRKALRTIPECECLTCHTLFRPRVAGRKFCSVECAHSRRIEDRECSVCQRMFTPKTAQGMVCSKACHMRLHRVRKAERAGTTYKPAGSTFTGCCHHCGQAFLARSPKAIYCGPRCNDAASKARRRQKSNVITFVPAYQLTASVFDGWFRRAG